MTFWSVSRCYRRKNCEVNPEKFTDENVSYKTEVEEKYQKADKTEAEAEQNYGYKRILFSGCPEDIKVIDM